MLNDLEENAADGGGSDDEPDQDPMIPSSRAIMVPGLLSQRRVLGVLDLDRHLEVCPTVLVTIAARSSISGLVDTFCMLVQKLQIRWHGITLQRPMRRQRHYRSAINVHDILRRNAKFWRSFALPRPIDVRAMDHPSSIASAATSINRWTVAYTGDFIDACGGYPYVLQQVNVTYKYNVRIQPLTKEKKLAKEKNAFQCEDIFQSTKNNKEKKPNENRNINKLKYPYSCKPSSLPLILVRLERPPYRQHTQPKGAPSKPHRSLTVAPAIYNGEISDGEKAFQTISLALHFP
ncbi:hypothetical protein M5K25_001234 [Dendrobium thyrsiflorum]|uniref:Uncharacterized protein n=1 Tax=Dendrobium thyrsiflorum TaxID=117978 RepID=A0ABD0VR23_DENTH